jgi:hypothetical protein
MERKRLTALVLGAAIAPAAVAEAAKAPSPTVTVAAAATQVVYGSATGLSGAVSSQQTGEKVTVQAEACGQNAFKNAGTTTTAAAGTWSLAVRPTMTTQYRAKVKSSTSPTVTVGVRPRITLSKAGKRKYKVRVTAEQSFAGRLVTFQRFRASSQSWVRVRKATLRQISTGPGATVVSGITLRSRIQTGRRVRVVLAKAQAGACYLAGLSNVIRS